MDTPWSEWSSTLASHSWCLTMKVKGSAVNLVPCDCGMLGAPVGDLREPIEGPPPSQEFFRSDAWNAKTSVLVERFPRFRFADSLHTSGRHCCLQDR